MGGLNDPNEELANEFAALCAIGQAGNWHWKKHCPGLMISLATSGRSRFDW